MCVLGWTPGCRYFHVCVGLDSRWHIYSLEPTYVNRLAQIPLELLDLIIKHVFGSFNPRLYYKTSYRGHVWVGFGPWMSPWMTRRSLSLEGDNA